MSITNRSKSLENDFFIEQPSITAVAQIEIVNRISDSLQLQNCLRRQHIGTTIAGHMKGICNLSQVSNCLQIEESKVEVKSKCEGKGMASSKN